MHLLKFLEINSLNTQNIYFFFEWIANLNEILSFKIICEKIQCDSNYLRHIYEREIYEKVESKKNRIWYFFIPSSSSFYFSFLFFSFSRSYCLRTHVFIFTEYIWKWRMVDRLSAWIELKINSYIHSDTHSRCSYCSYTLMRCCLTRIQWILICRPTLFNFFPSNITLRPKRINKNCVYVIKKVCNLNIFDIHVFVSSFSYCTSKIVLKQRKCLFSSVLLLKETKHFQKKEHEQIGSTTSSSSFEFLFNAKMIEIEFHNEKKRIQKISCSAYKYFKIKIRHWYFNSIFIFNVKSCGCILQFLVWLKIFKQMN